MAKLLILSSSAFILLSVALPCKLVPQLSESQEWVGGGGGGGVGLPYKLALFKVVTWRCATSGRGQYAGGRWVLIFGRRGDGCMREVIWLDWHQEQPQAVLFRDKVFFVLFFIAGMLPRDGRGLGTKKQERTTIRKKGTLLFSALMSLYGNVVRSHWVVVVGGCGLRWM